MAVFKRVTQARHTTRHDAGCCSTAALQRNCTILDLSSGGAHQLADVGSIGNRVSVALTRDVRKVTHCRLVWRKDTIIGVEFVGRT